MRAFGALLAAAAIAACSTSPVQSPPVAPASASASPPPESSAGASGLPQLPAATGAVARRWYTVPDGLNQDRAAVAVSFAGDATAGRPRARLRSTGETTPLSFAVAPRVGPQWSGSLPLTGAAPGEQTVEFVVGLANGSDAVAATATFTLSAPEYLVWTLDFEGDAATNDALDNTYAASRAYVVPMTIMWNPRVWTTTAVPDERAAVMRQWTMNIAERGHGEIALHLHAWTDFVRAAGVTPRTSPSWAGRGDGYDVPLTAFSEAETKQLIDHALALMARHGMPRPTTFRAGGLFANAANLRAVSAAGFTVDTSAAPAGPFGQLQLPWTLRQDAQPYRPSSADANVAGDLPLLELPNIAGNTYGHTATSIQRTVNDDLAMLAPAGQPASERRVLTLVSHPSTVDATERAAIETLFRAFEPFRYDRDAGPLRFVTASELARAFK